MRKHGGEEDDLKVCGVCGLEDGHTIHLVPGASASEGASASNNNDGSNSNTNTNTSGNGVNNGTAVDEIFHNASNGHGSGTSPMRAGILNALFALGRDDADNDNGNNNDNDNDNDNDESAIPIPSGFMFGAGTGTGTGNGMGISMGTTTTNTTNTTTNTGSTSRVRRRRPNSHRRTANDARYQDPCPLEPVRQGLMTLHTMMGTHAHGDGHTRTHTHTHTENTHYGIESDHHHCNRNGNGNDRSNSNSGGSSGGNNRYPNSALTSPLDASRWWYKGQWLDVRDTVNQWLEATVVEVASPDDILHRVKKDKKKALHNGDHNDVDVDVDVDYNPTVPATDAAIGANDMEGRLQLLLQPSPNPTDRTLADLNAHANDNDDDNTKNGNGNDCHMLIPPDMDLTGLTERANNDNVQLLLVHYNGWPHRWDEWIRSDSERIRPFRTRSRHVPSRTHYCPSPESNFLAAPSTRIKMVSDDGDSDSDGGGRDDENSGNNGDDDVIERAMILPELYSAIGDVQELFAGAIRLDMNHDQNHDNHQDHNPLENIHMDQKMGIDLNNKSDVDVDVHVDMNRPLSDKEQSDLTKAMQELTPDVVEDVLTIVQGENEGGKDVDPSDIEVAALDHETQWKLKQFLDHCGTNGGAGVNTGFGAGAGTEVACNALDIVPDRQLPWKINTNYNRLEDGGENAKLPNFDKKALESLAPLLDRLGRILIDVAPHVATIADSLPDKDKDNNVSEAEENANANANANETSQANSEDDAQADSQTQIRELRPSWAQGPTPSLFESESEETSGRNENDNASTNPDYVDFIHGFINHRNEGSSRRGTQGRNNSDSNDVGSSILSGFLASALRGDSDGNNRSNNRNGPRVVRVGGGGTGNGGNGNGIDIHIHAIVTGGNGGDPSPGGIASMIAPSLQRIPRPSARNNTPTRNAAQVATPAVDEEEMGLFDELYLEDSSERNNRQPDSWQTWSTRNRDEVEIAEDDSDDEEIPALMAREDSDDSSIDSGSSMPALVRRRADFEDSSDDDCSDDEMPEVVSRVDVDVENSDGEVSNDEIPELLDRAPYDSSSDDDCSDDEMPPALMRRVVDTGTSDDEDSNDEIPELVDRINTDSSSDDEEMPRLRNRFTDNSDSSDSSDDEGDNTRPPRRLTRVNAEQRRLTGAHSELIEARRFEMVEIMTRLAGQTTGFLEEESSASETETETDASSDCKNNAAANSDDVLFSEEEPPIRVDTLPDAVSRDGSEAEEAVEIMQDEHSNDVQVDTTGILNAGEVDVDDNIDAHEITPPLIHTLPSDQHYHNEVTNNASEDADDNTTVPVIHHSHNSVDNNLGNDVDANANADANPTIAPRTASLLRRLFLPMGRNSNR